MIIMRMKGVRRLVRKLQRERKEIGDAIGRGLYEAGSFLQAASQRIVPRDTGNLKDSAYTSQPEGSGLKTKVTVGYTANYAVFVHENLKVRHAPGKTAKFLERPARELRRELAEIVREIVQEAAREAAK